jgi:hypothetical protein
MSLEVVVIDLGKDQTLVTDLQLVVGQEEATIILGSSQDQVNLLSIR